MSRLVDYLRTSNHVGKAKAIRRADLSKLLGISIRELRVLCEEARNAGEFVAYSTSADGGIFLAETDEEKLALVGAIRETCLKRLRQYSALKRALADRYQRTLFPESVDQVFSKGSKRS